MKQEFEQMEPASYGEFKELIDKSIGAIVISARLKPDGMVRFEVAYDGDTKLLYNSFLELFRSNDKLAKMANRACLEVLHEKTVKTHES